MNRQKLILAISLAAGLVLAIAVVAQTQESTPTGCLDEQTRWKSFAEPDTTFGTAEEAVAATLSDLGFKASDATLAEAAASSQAEKADPGPIQMTIETGESGVSALQVTISKVSDKAYAAGDAIWCRADA
jgi:hypothetical protein